MHLYITQCFYLQVDADEAARQAQIAATRRVGTGGLHEQAAEGGGDDSAGEAAGEVPAVRQVLSTSEKAQCIVTTCNCIVRS